jgi:methionyl-tRNA formyltransferase
MLLQRATQIGEQETAGSLHDRLAGIGSETLLEALDAMTRDAATPRAQPAQGATYASKILKQEALVDWSRTAAEIDRQVRAFNPWPVAETRCAGRQLRIWESQPLGDSNASPPGTVMRAGRDGIHVATARGTLNLTRVQLAGGRAMSAAEFANAHRLDGTVLGS